MSMTLDSLEKLYVHELKDLYSAENQILEALPALIQSASDSGLVAALEHHRQETLKHVDRLERIFEGLEFEPGGHKCAGMEGLLGEGESVLEDTSDPSVRDAAIISGAQRVEHYEIAGYGTARAYAEKLGDYRAADLLQKSLNEEAMADQTLSRLAERKINFEAMKAG
jgi:ferritin-like metal-binding protein YciE